MSGKFKLNSAGVRELLKSKGLADVLKSYAEEVRRNTGMPEGYILTTHVGKNRTNVAVEANSKKARSDNLKNNTLLKALGSVRE